MLDVLLREVRALVETELCVILRVLLVMQAQFNRLLSNVEQVRVEYVKQLKTLRIRSTQTLDRVTSLPSLTLFNT